MITSKAAKREVQEKNSATATDKQYIQHASRSSGISPIKLANEYRKLAKKRGKLKLSEYVQWAVYNPELSQEQKEAYLSNFLHWPITHKVCDMTWQATTEDKWLCAHLLEGSNVQMPETLAVFDASNRLYPKARKLSTIDDFKDFAISRKGVPFFGKENRGIASLGAFLATDADADRIHLKGRGWIDYDAFAEEFLTGGAYILQPVEKNDPFFDKFTETLATVRICILMDESGVHIPFAVLKLPYGDNIADCFWRDGNIACDIDPASGRIRRAVTKTALGTTEQDTYPGTDHALLGETLPHWESLLTLVGNCSPVFAPVRYQSMDIALTPSGPLLIEINTGGGFDLPQLASGKGFLTPEVSAFFRKYGYEGL